MLGNDDGFRVHQIMGPQPDFKFWQRVKAAAANPPVTGLPAEVNEVMQLRQVGVGYHVENKQYVYF